MSEIAKEELRSRINGLSDEEKVLVLYEMPFELLLDVFNQRIIKMMDTEKYILDLLDILHTNEYKCDYR